MKKACFSQEVVDAQKFRECATCHLFDECTRTVYLKGVRKASAVGQVLGFLLCASALVLAVARWGDMPHGAPWLALVALVYGLSVYRAGKEYGADNLEQAERLDREAEAKPEAAAVQGAHH